MSDKKHAKDQRRTRWMARQHESCDRHILKLLWDDWDEGFLRSLTTEDVEDICLSVQMAIEKSTRPYRREYYDGGEKEPEDADVAH